jgi:AmmeMemoRadiSam system protein B
MNKLRVIFIALIITMLGACSTEPAPSIGLILPHHLIVEDKIDEVYELVSNYDFEQVLIIGPNHFGLGFNPIQTNRENFLSENIEIVKIEDDDYDKEHSIFSHYEFIDKYFSKAQVESLIIKQGVDRKLLDELIEGLNSLDLNSTLVIASIDFAHGISEEQALQSDNEIINWLESVPRDSDQIFEFNDGWGPDQVALDSPETLYVVNSIFDTAKIEVIERTSSGDMLNFTNGDLNTSHIFARLFFDE